MCAVIFFLFFGIAGAGRIDTLSSLDVDEDEVKGQAEIAGAGRSDTSLDVDEDEVNAQAENSRLGSCGDGFRCCALQASMVNSIEARTVAYLWSKKSIMEKVVANKATAAWLLREPAASYAKANMHKEKGLCFNDSIYKKGCIIKTWVGKEPNKKLEEKRVYGCKCLNPAQPRLHSTDRAAVFDWQVEAMGYNLTVPGGFQPRAPVAYITQGGHQSSEPVGQFELNGQTGNVVLHNDKTKPTSGTGILLDDPVIWKPANWRHKWSCSASTPHEESSPEEE